MKSIKETKKNILPFNGPSRTKKANLGGLNLLWMSSNFICKLDIHCWDIADILLTLSLCGVGICKVIFMSNPIKVMLGWDWVELWLSWGFDNLQKVENWIHFNCVKTNYITVAVIVAVAVALPCVALPQIRVYLALGLCGGGWWWVCRAKFLCLTQLILCYVSLILPGQMLPWQLQSVLYLPRNPPLKILSKLGQ